MSKDIHPIQQQLMKLAIDHDVANMRLVDLAHLLDIKHLQQVKHHREQLVKRGDLQSNQRRAVRTIKLGNLELLEIPILGTVS